MAWVRSDSVVWRQHRRIERSSKQGGKPVRELGAGSYGTRNREQTRLAVTRKKGGNRGGGVEIFNDGDSRSRIRYD